MAYYSRAAEVVQQERAAEVEVANMTRAVIAWAEAEGRTVDTFHDESVIGPSADAEEGA